MSKYRRKENSSDSLELLLDTMCNTFGGIMFIAISLLIISSFISKNITAVEQVDPVGIKNKTKLIMAELSEIRKKQTLKLSVIKGLKNSPINEAKQDLAELKTQNAIILKRNNKLKNEIELIEHKLEILKENNISRRNAILIAENSCVEGEKELKKLKKEYALLIASGCKTVKRETGFRKLTTTQKLPIWGLLVNNRLARITHSDEIEQFDNSDGGLRLAVKNGKGLAIPEFDHYLSTLDSRQVFLSLFVFPDSYKAMIALEKLMLKHDLRFNWYPVVDSYDCVLYPIQAGDVYKSQ